MNILHIFPPAHVIVFIDEFPPDLWGFARLTPFLLPTSSLSCSLTIHVLSRKAGANTGCASGLGFADREEKKRAISQPYDADAGVMKEKSNPCSHF
jgi:hypothetical protein